MNNYPTNFNGTIISGDKTNQIISDMLLLNSTNGHIYQPSSQQFDVVEKIASDTLLLSKINDRNSQSLVGTTNDREIDIFLEKLYEQYPTGYCRYFEALQTMNIINQRFGKTYTDKHVMSLFDRIDRNHDDKIVIKELIYAFRNGIF